MLTKHVLCLAMAIAKHRLASNFRTRTWRSVEDVEGVVGVARLGDVNGHAAGRHG